MTLHSPDDLLRELFGELLGLDAAGRSVRLDEIAREHPQLAEELADLLCHHDSPAPVLGALTDTAARMMAEQSPTSTPERIGPYKVHDVLGQGGMGIVYSAEQDTPHRRVAIKVLRPGLLTPSLLQRFHREVEVLGRLNHPGIAQVFDAGTCELGFGEQPFFVMEHVDGQSLSVALADTTVSQRVETLARIADAVAHAHERGVIHRDLKPANILVNGPTDTNGGCQPKVLDFGVARLGSDAAETMAQTHHGTLLGTLAYMSPEQAAGTSAGPTSDVYSLGVMLYEVLAGRPPHDLNGKSLTEAARVIQYKEPLRLRLLDKRLHGDLEIIVQKAMAKEPAQRYQQAAEFAADLRRFLDRQPIHARRLTAWYQLRRFARRNRGLTASLLALGLALVIGFSGTTMFALEASANRDLADRSAFRSAQRAYAGAMLAASTQLREQSYAAEAALLGTEERFRGCEWHVMHAALDRADLLYELPAAVRAQHAFSPAGVPIVVQAIDGQMTAMDIQKGEAIGEWRAPGNVGAVWISPDTTLVATPHEGGRLMVWRLEDGAVLFDRKDEEKILRDLRFTEDNHFLVSASSYPGRANIRVDLQTGEWSTFREAGNHRMYGILPDSRTFSDAGGRRDIATGEHLGRMSPYDKLTVLSPDGTLVAGLVHWHRQIYLGQTDDPATHMSSVTTLPGEPTSVQFSRDGKLLVSASWTCGHIKVNDVHTRELLHDIILPCDHVPSVHPTGDSVLTRTPRGIEQIPLQRRRFVLEPHRDYLVAAAFSPDGLLVASAATSGHLTIWDVDSGQMIRESRPASFEPRGLAFARDGLSLFMTDRGNSLFEIDLATGTIQRLTGAAAGDAPDAPIWQRIQPGSHLWRCRQLGMDGRTLVSHFGVHDVAAGRELLPKTFHYEMGKSVPDQVGAVGEVQYRMNRYRPVNANLSVSVSHDGHLVAMGLAKGVVLVWDVLTGKHVQTLRTHLGYVHALAFGPDDRLVSGGIDGEMRIWNPRTGDCLGVFKDHERAVECIVWSPDGSRFLTASGDRTVRIHDTVVSWQRGRNAAARGRHDEAMAVHAQAVLQRHAGDKTAALQGIWTDAALSLEERQSARAWLLRH